MSGTQLARVKNIAVQPPSTSSPQLKSRAFFEDEKAAVEPSMAVHNIERVTSQPSQLLQAKLSFGEPNDTYEQEADKVAAQIVEQINLPEIAQSKASYWQSDQTKDIPSVQSKALDKPTDEPLGDLEASIQSARGGGQSISESARKPLEKAFGFDFRKVKIHSDTNSNQLSQSIQAKAFTTGQDIFFKEGEYQPGSRIGQKLLAHELTHVVQQNQDAKPPKSSSEISKNFGEFNQIQTSPVQVRTIQCSVEDESIWTLLNTLGGDAGNVGGGAGLMNDISTAFRSPALPTIGSFMGPLGLITGAIGAADPNSSISDRVAGGASAFSGGVGTANMIAGMFGSSNLFAAGGTAGAAGLNTSVGAAFGVGAGSTGAAAASAIGSAGAVVGAGAAGYGIGRLLDRGIGEGMNITGLSGMMDEQRGIRRPEGQHGDYSLSGMGSENLLGKDQRFTGFMRAIGVYDRDKPAYTQTIGWKLSEWLGI